MTGRTHMHASSYVILSKVTGVCSHDASSARAWEILVHTMTDAKAAVANCPNRALMEGLMASLSYLATGHSDGGRSGRPGVARGFASAMILKSSGPHSWQQFQRTSKERSPDSRGSVSVQKSNKCLSPSRSRICRNPPAVV